MDELVTQAHGRPGLAVTLAWLCLKGDVRTVISGEALFLDIRSTLLPFVGEKAMAILAAFAVGGQAGMYMGDVAKGFEIPLIDVQEKMTHLSAAGVVNDVGDNKLAVNPRPLRHALVSDSFYKGARSLSIGPFLSRAPDNDEAALTLIGARGRGAKVPDAMLQQLVSQSRHDLVLRSYASLGSKQSEWILGNFPEKLSVVADEALNTSPRTTIPLLLDRAVSDDREPNSYPQHPMRALEDWVKSAWPGKGAVVRRRECLLDCTLKWCAEGGDKKVAMRSLRWSLFPGFQSVESDPGSGHTVTFTTGGLTLGELSTIEPLWIKICGLIQGLDVEDWSSLQETIRDWVNGPSFGRGETPEVHHERRSFAKKCYAIWLKLLQRDLA